VGKGVTLLVLAGVGLIAALALGDALRPGARSSAPLSTVPTMSDAPTAEVVVDQNVAPRQPKMPRRFCGSFRVAPEGDYPLLLVEVLKGDTSCEEARRVIEGALHQRGRGLVELHRA
jgi:hypothetical protein